MMGAFSDRIADRELDEGGGAGGGGGRIIGRRLMESYAHYKRYVQIMNSLSRFGFGYVLDRVRTANPIPRLEKEDSRHRGSPRAVRIRLMFEELGPTFIKIGQLLTTQEHLVPADLVCELENLKDDVDAMPFDEVRQLVESDLGGPIGDLFSDFGHRPIGSASIGQVHRAVLKDGRKVAVKVRKAGTKEMVLADMEILEDMAGAFGSLLEVSELMDPVELVRELRRNLVRELDYTVEGRSIEHFRRDFEGDLSVRIPAVYWKLTTRRVLTMDLVAGIPAGDAQRLNKLGTDTGKVATVIGTAVARMIFVNGYFHGDLHGGNIRVHRDGSVAFLDFGSVGYLDATMRDRVRLFYLAVAREDVPRAVDVFMNFCGVSDTTVSRPALEQDFREFLDYHRLRREGHEIAEGMNQKLVSVALKHGFAPPAQFILLERALMQTEDICSSLSGGFDINAMMSPIIAELVEAKVKEALDPLAAMQSAREYRELARTGPRKVQSILDKLDAGTLVVKVDPDFVQQMRRDIWRVVFIMGVSLMAMMLLFVIVMMGREVETPFLGLTVTVAPVFLVWMVTVWWIYRRWGGPR